jgi:hypothetical protein
MKKDNPREIMDAVMLNTEFEVDDENEDINEKLIKSKNKSKRDEFEVTKEMEDDNKEYEFEVTEETREVMLKTNPEGKYDEVDVVMKKDNPREIMDAVMLNTEYEVDDENEDKNEKLIKSKNESKRDEVEVTEEMEDVNKEYEAGIKAHQGRKPNRYGMLKTNPEGKYDEVNVERKRGNMRQEQVEQLLKVRVTGFDKDECFIKGDGFKDDSKDIADEETMKQDKAPKNQEISKKELAAIQLSDSCSSQLPVLTKLSHHLCEQLRLILKPTKAVKLQGDFRTGKRLSMRKIISYIASQFKKDNVMKERVGDMYEKRDAMGNINPEGSYDEVSVTKERVRDMYEETEKRDAMNNINPEGSYERDVVVDITDAVMLNTEYEAGVKVHRGRELNMNEKPELRDGMLETNPKVKDYDNVNVNNMMDLQLYNDNYYQYSTSSQEQRRRQATTQF